MAKGLLLLRNYEEGINIRNSIRTSKSCVIVGAGPVGPEIIGFKAARCAFIILFNLFSSDNINQNVCQLLRFLFWLSLRIP